MIENTCKVCEKTFTAKSEKAVYCTPKCRTKAYRAKKKAPSHRHSDSVTQSSQNRHTVTDRTQKQADDQTPLERIFFAEVKTAKDGEIEGLRRQLREKDGIIEDLKDDKAYFKSRLDKQSNGHAAQLAEKDEQIRHFENMQHATALQLANKDQQLQAANEQKALAQGTLDKDRAGKQRRDRLRYWRKKFKAATTDDARAKCEEMIRENGGQ